MTSKTFQNLALLALMPFLLTSCFIACSLFDSNETVYYDVEGEGYVIFADTEDPAPNAVVIVYSAFKGHTGIAPPSPVEEHYSTDSTGYYRVRFLRCAEGRDVYSRYLSVYVPNTTPNYYILRWGNAKNGPYWKDVPTDIIQKAKVTIRLDTAKLYLESSLYPQN